MGKLINNPALNDFVYTVLFHASLEEKRGLKGKYLKAAMDGKAAKVFATTSTLEEKEHLLAHFGVESFFVFAKRGMNLLKFKDILEKFDKRKRVSAIADIAQEGVFVTSDKEFLRLLGIMSQAIHHPSYVLNLEMDRQGYHIKKWAKKYTNKEDVHTRELEANAKLLAQTCLSANLMMDFTPGNTGISAPQMKILLFLYTLSHIYVSEERILSALAGSVGKIQYAAAMRPLVAGQFVLRHAKGKEYTIAGPGIRQVNEYMSRTLTLNTF